MSAYIKPGERFEHDKELNKQKIQKTKLYNPLEVNDGDTRNNYSDSKFGPIDGRYSPSDLSYSTLDKPISDKEESQDGEFVFGAYIPGSD